MKWLVLVVAVAAALLVAGSVVMLRDGDSGRPVAAAGPSGTSEDLPEVPDTVPSEAPTATPQNTDVPELTATPGGQAPKVETVPQYADGCDHNYGVVPLCVPWAFPQGSHGSMQAKCAWLVAHGFTNIPVKGTDRQGLDPDKNGIACDK
ncbi:MAG: hypothetical protein ABIS86_02865 [Streptosporangiaceae bacterium]